MSPGEDVFQNFSGEGLQPDRPSASHVGSHSRPTWVFLVL